MTDSTGRPRSDDDDRSSSPFVRHRRLLESHRAALAAGMSDAAFVDLVWDLDRRVAEVDGTGFRQTPLVELETPLDRTVLAKVETANVGRSHKARHLFGLLLHAEVKAWTAAHDRTERRAEPRLAIASCGNAALGAAVVARAAHRDLDVYVPTDADPLVVAKLDDLGANVITCPRQPGASGDPCIHRLNAALDDGAEAFTVQGTTCPDVFDGARTIGFELVEQLDQAGVTPTDLYLQVGGGAFGTAVVDGLKLAGMASLPRLHPVQPRQAHPYAVAWQRLTPRLLAAMGRDEHSVLDLEVLDALATEARTGSLDALLGSAVDVMTPWPSTPESIATGILDDITYDWLPLMSHQIATGGWPLLPTEDDLRRATELASAQVTPPPDATGAAGLAGALIDTGPVPGQIAADPPRGPALVVLSGIDRQWEQMNQQAITT